MKVKELIRQLQEFDPEDDVEIYVASTDLYAELEISDGSAIRFEMNK